MKKLLILSFLSVLLFVGCEKESPINSIKSTEKEPANLIYAKEQLLKAYKEGKLIPRFGALLDKTQKGSENLRTSADHLNFANNADYNFNRELVKRAINPNDYECGPTVLDPYIDSIIADWVQLDFVLYNFFGSSVALDYAYVLGNANKDDYFGTTGQYTNAMNRNFKDLQRFWNIPSDIELRDGHGNIYNDVAGVTYILRLYGYSPTAAASNASFLKTVYGTPKYLNFNHPLLTFNAFAAPADPDFETPKQIVMGDGIMQAYGDLGFSDVAPVAILAHEYAHQVQFAKNVPFFANPESTRRTELMADALASYFLTHGRGSAMNAKRVEEFYQVFYSIGDCGFTSNGHHGTPNQRMKASQFGFKIAEEAQNSGHILTAEAFIALFNAELPTLVAPDAAP